MVDELLVAKAEILRMRDTRAARRLMWGKGVLVVSYAICATRFDTGVAGFPP